MKKPKNLFFKILTLVLIIIIIAGIKELKLIVNSIQQGIWYFLILAGFFQVSVYAFQSEVRRSLYSILDIKEKFWDMMKMTFSAMFIGTAIPSFHMAALGLFMKEARAKGYSQSKALVAGITFLFFDTLGFFLALIVALFLLFRLGDLNRIQVGSSLILVAVMIFGAGLIAYILKSESRVRKFFKKMSRLMPKNERKKWFPENEINLLAKDTIEAKTYYLKSKRKLWKPFVYAILTQVSGALTLTSCFLAFGLPFNINIIVIVYAMAVLFQIVAVTPYGLGSAELLLTLILSQFGISLSQALLLTLTFRFFTFWIPMIVGYASLKKISGENLQEIEQGTKPKRS